MSEEDQRKWNARYRQGAYQSRPHPSAFLAECADLLPSCGRALDVACGAGRNALFLARRGLVVDAVDISPVALERGRRSAGTLPIHWLEADLEAGFAPAHEYDVIVNIRYVQLDLLTALLPSLRPGGALVVEQHLLWAGNEKVTGPENPAFRVAPGALSRLAGNLEVQRQDEGLVTEPDGSVVALARLFARRPALIGSLRDQIDIKGDVVSTGTNWRADARPRCAEAE